MASFALSAIDIALWDLKGKKAQLPLWRLLGGVDNKTKTYAGAIDFGYSQEELLKNIENYLNSGHRAVKIKVGNENINSDIERAQEVRNFIGDEKKLMVDANASWNVEEAIRAAAKLKKYDILWLEEPTEPEDFSGYARISTEGDIAVAGGENIHTIYDFKRLIQEGGVDFPQPDASNIGGITGWLRAANLAYSHNLSVCSHGMHELHVSLMSAITNSAYMEVHSFPIDKYTTNPLKIKNGKAYAPDVPGTGVEFKREVLNMYES